MRPRHVFFYIFVAIIATGWALLAVRRNAINAQCPRGLIEDRAAWPKYLVETITPLQQEGLIPNQLDGFRLSAWSNDYFALRFPAEGVSTDRLVKAMALTRDDDNIGVREFRNRMPSEWNLDDRPTAEYYVSAAWLTGDEADRYVLRFDLSDEFVYVYYYYNF